MFVYGGKGSSSSKVLDLEIYNTECSEWLKFPCVGRHRHGIWVSDTCLYIFGGFDKGSSIPTNTIQVIDLAKLFINEMSILKVILEHVIVKNQCENQKLKSK